MRFSAGPATEQGLEADAHDPPTIADHPTGNGVMRAVAVAAGERQEGNGRGDAVRLSTEISSRGTKVRCGEAKYRPSGRERRKRGEPHDR